ncbi:hypothetical protein K461DRAFT_286447 [Myriangium duriaei CBS 260.36]|uniref:Uncharacterized protein n=1 Tax=Myriangium duriaei CBS 260.36 TaxID=1168546 RepID=A0A9P4MGV5_9PEZI|nr:hypothetical protein K461DRAFT_286447 [Myriangium duriaei CBS 260.36]
MVLEARGGPYRQTNQSGGELPSKIPDIPLSIVLLVVFMVAGGSHMFLLIRNKKRGHKFLVNGMVFGLCNVRIFTFCLRTAWALHPTSIRLGIASTIFVYAGTILLWMANLLFAQRLVRAQHPRFGWSKPVTLVFPILCAIIVLTLLMLIVTVIQQFYTESTNTHRIDRDFQLYAQTCYAIMAFLPIPIVLISTAAGSLPSVIASRQHTPVDKFGKGRITHKINLILFSAVFLALGAGFRCGTTWKQPVPSHTPTGELVAQPWYYTKAAFYSFNFGIELIVVFAWLIFRIDQMFHIPDGAYEDEV